MKKIILIFIYIIYWIFTFIYVFNKEENSFSYLALYLILFMPLTLTIIFEYDVPALFIIILDQFVEGLIGFFMLISLIANYEVGNVGNSVLLIITAFISVLLALTMIISAIKLLSNKSNLLKYYVLSLSAIHVILLIINFIVAKDLSLGSFSEAIRTLTFVIVLAVYIVTFPKKEIQIFKQ